MANTIEYPVNPSIGDEFTVGGTRKRWDGTKWKNVSFGNHEVRIDKNFRATKALLQSLGLSGNFGFFDKGFTYTEEGDVGIDENNQFWLYNGSLPFEVVKGTVPSEPDYNVFDHTTAVGAHGSYAIDFKYNLVTEAINRSVYDKLIERGLSIADFGGDPTGATDSTQAYELAMTYSASKTVILTDGDWLFATPTTIPDNSAILGLNRETCKIIKGHNGDLFTDFGTGASIERVYIDGNSGNFATGKGLLINGTKGRQYIDKTIIKNFNDYCIDFTHIDAGSQFVMSNSIVSRSNGLIADGYCVNMARAPIQLSAKPRKFINIETEGTKFIHFGSCNNVYVTDCFAGGYGFNEDSRAVGIINGRVVGLDTLSIEGSQNRFVGVAISPPVVLEPGTDDNIIDSILNNGITDNSGNGRNSIYTRGESYTPNWTSAGVTQPSIGDGNIRGEYSRQGDTVFFAINLTIGSTTTLGDSTWQFEIPFVPRTESSTVQIVQAQLIQGGVSKLATARLVPNAVFTTVQVDGTFVRSDQPSAWVDGDTLRICGYYSV